MNKKTSKKGLVLGLALVLVAAMLVIVLPMNASAATTWYVDDVAGSGPGNPAEDFTSIQDAIDAASVGDTIFVYAGTYNELLTIDKSLTLEGEDSDTTILQGSGTGNGITMSSISGVTIKNLNIKDFTIGIISNSCQSITMTDNKLSECSPAIQMNSNEGNTLSGNQLTGGGMNTLGFEMKYWNTHTIDTSNTVNGNPVYYWKDKTSGKIPKDAGEVILANCQNIKVTNLDVSGGSVGIGVGFSSKCKITNNEASNGIRGMYFQNAYDCIVSENTCSGNSYAGIHTDSSGGNFISENDIFDNYHGIQTSTCTGDKISDNSLSGNSGYGLYISHFSSNQKVMGNTVTGGSRGIYIYYTSDSVVGENDVSGCSYNGIRLFRSNGNTVKENTVSDIYTYGVHLRLSNNNVVKENTIYDIYRDGIVLESSNYNTVKENTIYDNGFIAKNGDGIWVYYSSYNTLLENSLKDNYLAGIRFFNSDNNIAIKNMIKSNEETGIYLDSSDGNTMYYNNFIDHSVHAVDLGTNTWDDGAGMGNYWDDYIGKDTDHDGVGDTLLPHYYDNYPLMKKYN